MPVRVTNNSEGNLQKFFFFFLGQFGQLKKNSTNKRDYHFYGHCWGEEGLGFGNLHYMNRSLFVQVVLEIYMTKEGSVQKRVMPETCHYLSAFVLLVTNFLNLLVWDRWDNISCLWGDFDPLSRFSLTIGDEIKIQFWKDVWPRDLLLKDFSQDFFLVGGVSRQNNKGLCPIGSIFQPSTSKEGFWLGKV